MASPVDIRPDHLKIVQDILREYLPVDVRVWVFGSRAIWTTKDSSDLDLALESEGRLSHKLLGALKDAFEDSALPYTVDIVDLSRISESFRDIVVSQRAPLSMDGDRPIDITASQRKAILALLEKYLPNTTAWVYGSRVKWTSRPQSDLDLVVFPTPNQERKVSDLREAFEESNLPFQVDLFVWDEVPEQFRKEIEAEHVVLVEREERGTVGKWRDTVYGPINSDFSENRLADLCVPISGVQTGPFGSQLHKKDYVKVGTPIITVEHLGENRILQQGVPCVSEKDRLRLSKYWLQTGDIVFSRVGSVDRRALVRDAEDGWLFSGRCLRVRPDPKEVDPAYLSYFFGLPVFQEFIRSIAVGATMPSLNTRILSDAPILYPSLPEQRAIAHILGTLDDKIELNRRMNETLEAMARALFKSWFVDFDPVHAKSALKRHKSITPPLRGSRQGKGASPQASRWGVSRPQLHRREEIKRLYSPLTLKRAKALRQSRSDAEGLLWHYLRKKQLDGHKFRRQQPIGRYIVDFVCMAEKLVIELDGGQHSTQRVNLPRFCGHEQRDQFLTDQGYRVLRFWNSVVFENCYGVLESILATLRHDPVKGTECPPPQPAEPVSTHPQGGNDWTVERAKAYLDRMDPEIADLFPDRLVPSELGEIPEGWEVKRLGDVVELNPSESLKKGTVVPYLPMASLPTTGPNPDDWISREYKSGTRFRNDDTLLARITPCLENGKTAFVQSLPKDTVGWGSTEFIILRAIPPVPPEFTYLLARDAAFREHAIQSMTGTSGRQRVQINALAPYLLPFPPSDVWVKFRSHISPLFAKIEIIRKVSRSLAAQRDALLPKLVSGEIRT